MTKTTFSTFNALRTSTACLLLTAVIALSFHSGSASAAPIIYQYSGTFGTVNTSAGNANNVQVTFSWEAESTTADSNASATVGTFGGIDGADISIDIPAISGTAFTFLAGFPFNIILTNDGTNSTFSLSSGNTGQSVGASWSNTTLNIDPNDLSAFPLTTPTPDNGFIGTGFVLPDGAGNSIQILGGSSIAVSNAAVPEPGALAVFAFGVAGVGFMRRRKKA
ncbi:MAG: PEP-CTERM sorting domain-containing protein [Alphaproteobacteria bacterium]|nr:PEP-CTERM sorting domain-containing protein [Alphaproteobacteria bacterium]